MYENGLPDQQAPRESVARGLVLASLAVVGGVALTIGIWRLGYIASLTSFALAGGAVWLYAKGAGGTPRRGLVPLVLLIVLGVVASFFGVIASDLWEAYDLLPVTESRSTFILDNIARGEILREYGKDMALFGLFAVLGVFSTLRTLVSSS